MEKTIIKLGYCPTRRDVFSREAALQYNKDLREYMNKFDVELVDLKGINDEELLFEHRDLEAIIKRFKDANVDALFFPHCNFGSESLVALVAKAIGKPVLIWGPRDDAPLENGLRTRDSQCGMFATGKVLRRHNVPFTYLTNSWLGSKEFDEGFERFLAVACVIKSVTNLRILQISTRPEPFASVICNENELLERFGIQLLPITLTEVEQEMNFIKAKRGADFEEQVKFVKENISKESPIDQIETAIAMKMAVKSWCDKLYCSAAAIQCWNALQDITGIMPCLANALLADEGLPVACETDIHGAISAVMLQAATMNQKPQFFADITVRHPEDDNTELFWHCGPFPYSLAKDKNEAQAAGHWVLPSHAFGTCEWEIKGGDITVCRLDGDHGKYSMFIGEGVGTDGPKTRGTYVWLKVKNWPKWERKIVEGPYIHHVTGIHGKYAEILMEACKYMNGLEPDPVEPSLEELKERWG